MGAIQLTSEGMVHIQKLEREYNWKVISGASPESVSQRKGSKRGFQTIGIHALQNSKWNIHIQAHEILQLDDIWKT